MSWRKTGFLPTLNNYWLARAGSPVIEGGWSYDAATKHVVIELTQPQRGEAYRLPFEIGLASDGAKGRKDRVDAKAAAV